MKFLPEKILRRYTPPTCTLEIWGRSWQGLQKLRALPVEYRFQLHFDDPRLDEDQQASLQGDREQLRQLFELLVPYLQDFLDPQQGPARAQTTLSGPLTLRPLDLLRHEFHFPGLSSGPKEVLILSTSQLFDLVSALEAWQETQGAEQQPEPIAVLRPKIWALAASGLGVIVALVWGVSRFNRPSPEPITPALRPSSIPFAISNVIPPAPPPPPPTPSPHPQTTKASSPVGTFSPGQPWPTTPRPPPPPPPRVAPLRARLARLPAPPPPPRPRRRPHGAVRVEAPSESAGASDVGRRKCRPEGGGRREGAVGPRPARSPPPARDRPDDDPEPASRPRSHAR